MQRSGRVDGDDSTVLIDARAIPAGTELESDVCIIGAGAAGITLALEFLGADFDVCLLESGGFGRDDRTQSLYRATTPNRSFDWPPEQSRLRFFGGTTNHWSGWCRPLSPFDLEQHSWISNTGWPLSPEELNRYYSRARPILELDPAPDRPSSSTIEFDPERLTSETITFSPPTRFGSSYRAHIEQASNIKLLVHANVTRIQRATEAAQITHLRATSFERNSFEVKAKIFVLATGGIENPRLLLASNDVQPAGLGNDYDNVGRYFMEHPDLKRAARWLFSDPYALPALYKRESDRSPWSVVALADNARRKEGLLGLVYRLRPESSLTGRLVEHVREILGSRSDSSGARSAIVLCHAEQEPDANNRVTLSLERDELGMRRASVHWTVSSLVTRTFREGLDIFANEVGRLGFGRVQILTEEGDDVLSGSIVGGGTHPMGATRMATDPRRGVVDASSRVHGLPNLYVSGSSVFPTSGTSNPTLTIVALAIRLADQIKARFSQRNI